MAAALHQAEGDSLNDLVSERTVLALEEISALGRACGKVELTNFAQ